MDGTQKLQNAHLQSSYRSHKRSLTYPRYTEIDWLELRTTDPEKKDGEKEEEKAEGAGRKNKKEEEENTSNAFNFQN